MGLFSKKQKEPVVHAPVERTVYVRAGDGAVTAHLADYSSLFASKHATEQHVEIATSGDWTAIRLPPAVHPWQLHNLAYWMLDCPRDDADAAAGAGASPSPGDDVDVIAESAAGPTYPGYRLVRDPEIADSLSGWDHDGNGWTVRVPGNRIVRPEPVPVPRALSVPSGFATWTSVAVTLEDPGADMNPTNEATMKDRTRLASIDASAVW